jgi:hypothetical protein
MMPSIEAQQQQQQQDVGAVSGQTGPFFPGLLPAMPLYNPVLWQQQLQAMQLKGPAATTAAATDFLASGVGATVSLALLHQQQSLLRELISVNDRPAVGDPASTSAAAAQQQQQQQQQLFEGVSDGGGL